MIVESFMNDHSELGCCFVEMVLSLLWDLMGFFVFLSSLLLSVTLIPQNSPQSLGRFALIFF